MNDIIIDKNKKLFWADKLMLSYFIFQIILFSLLRNIFKSIYQPNVLLQEKKFTKNWISTLFNSNDNDFLSQKGLDAFFMLRYLKVLTTFFFSLSIINLPLLLPIHYQANVSNVQYVKHYNRKNDTTFCVLSFYHSFSSFCNALRDI